MLKRSRGSTPNFLMSSWMRCCSLSTVFGFADAALLWRLNSFKPFLTLNRANQPSLKLRRSSFGIPAKSANFVHFWCNTSPVRRTSSDITFDTHKSIIFVTSGCWVFVTSGCWVCRACFAVHATLQPHSSRHFSSSFTHAETRGCLILRLGYSASKCLAVFDWFSPLAWYQSRISMHRASVVFSFLVKTGTGLSFFLFGSLRACSGPVVGQPKFQPRTTKIWTHAFTFSLQPC